MRFLIFTLIFFTFLINKSFGDQNLIAEFLDNKINIDVGFTGTKLSYFGAIDTKGDLVIIVTGPRKKIKVFKKKKIWFWINTKSRVFSDVPSYYFVAASRPLNQIKNDSFLKINQIGLKNLRFEGAEEIVEEERIKWREGIINSMKKMGNYFSTSGHIEIIDDRLFKTEITFPSDIAEGIYIVDTLLLNNVSVIGSKRSFCKCFKIWYRRKSLLICNRKWFAFMVYLQLLQQCFLVLVNEVIRKIYA